MKIEIDEWIEGRKKDTQKTKYGFETIFGCSKGRVWKELRKL
jgi:hypothetical protein